jgi:ATP-binding cassette subfamily B protein
MKTSTVFKRLLTYIKPHKRYVFFAMIASFIQVGASLLCPLLIGVIIDYITGPAHVDFDAVFRLLLIFGALAFTATCAQLVVNYNTNTIAFHTSADLRNQLMTKINILPIRTLDDHPHGDFIQMMIGDIELISTGLLQGGTQFFTGILTIFGTIGLMFYTQFNITLLVLFLTPISIFVAHFIAKLVYVRYQAQIKMRGKMSSFLEEILTNKPLVMNLAYEPQAQERFDTLNDELYDKGWRAHFFAALVNPSTRIVNNIIYASVGIYGAMLVQNRLLTIGALSAFLSYANQYMKPFNEISTVMAELQAALASCARLFTVFDLPNEVADNASARPLTTIRGNVEMTNVNFSYTSAPFIKDLNFKAEHGQTIAIVGPTGCGKTTLINLLMRFYELDSGHITVDDIDALDITKSSLRAGFGMVLQDSWVFTGTVRENIAYGKPDATLREIIDAAQKAQVHHSIAALPDGYDTQLSSKYDLLSQGQKQLLCIARIMLLDPPVLILDEATSNIDTRTEISIGVAFEEMMKGRTSFIIAHRLSTIQKADVILVMRDGTIIEHGSHEQLLKKKGFYTELYNSQFSNL